MIAAMLAGHAGTGNLALDAVNICLTCHNFRLWYWALIVVVRQEMWWAQAGEGFLFTQQQPGANPERFADWSPGFLDYLFLAYTNRVLTRRHVSTDRESKDVDDGGVRHFARDGALVASRAVGILN